MRMSSAVIATYSFTVCADLFMSHMHDSKLGKLVLLQCRGRNMASTQASHFTARNKMLFQFACNYCQTQLSDLHSTYGNKQESFFLWPQPAPNQWCEVCWRSSYQTLGEKTEFIQDCSSWSKGPVIEIRSRTFLVSLLTSAPMCHLPRPNTIQLHWPHPQKGVKGSNNVTFLYCCKK